VPDILSGSSSPLLIYKDTPLVAAITISNDSFVVGMNKQSWEDNIGDPHDLEIGRLPNFPNIAIEPY
jgi:hypothetical protein